MKDELLHEIVIVLKGEEAALQGEAFVLCLLHSLRNLLVFGRYDVIVLPELLLLQI